jgi:hypothetical protein
MTVGLVISIIFIVLKYATSVEPMIYWTIWQCLVPMFIELGIYLIIFLAQIIIFIKIGNS